MAETVWINDIWLTARQWEVVQEALAQRQTAAARKVAERIWSQLVQSPGYQRHWHQRDTALAARGDGEA